MLNTNGIGKATQKMVRPSFKTVQGVASVHYVSGGVATVQGVTAGHSGLKAEMRRTRAVRETRSTRETEHVFPPH